MLPLFANRAIDSAGNLPSPYLIDWTRQVVAELSATTEPEPEPEPEAGYLLDTTIITAGAGISVYGSLASGAVIVGLAQLADSGTGTFKLLTRDVYGRLSGTANGTSADVPYVNTTSGLTADDVQAAVDELADEKLDDAPSDGSEYVRKDGAWAVATGGGGGATNFTDLGDVPAAYTGEAGKGVAVNATEDGLEFVPLTGSGTVTSVGLTNTGGGLTITGSPVTASGSINADLDAGTVASLALADSAIQSADLAAVATSGNAADVAIADAGAYFTGTDVEAALQELGAASGGGYAEGTSNPGSPSTNDKFFRTDLGLLIYYDGTRWLSANQYEVSGILGTASTMPFSATTVGVLRWPIRQDFGLYLERLSLLTYVFTTNNGSNYWTCVLESRNAANTVVATLATVVTSADTPSTWTNHDQTINAAIGSTAREILLNLTRTGTAGTTYTPCNLVYRLIVT